MDRTIVALLAILTCCGARAATVAANEWVPPTVTLVGFEGILVSVEATLVATGSGLPTRADDADPWPGTGTIDASEAGVVAKWSGGGSFSAVVTPLPAGLALLATATAGLALVRTRR